MIKTHIDSSVNIISKEHQEIRVLVHPLWHGNVRQSIALATLYAGHSSRRHQHLTSEETYHFIAGTGYITLGEKTEPVGPGDTVVVLPGTWHQIEADVNQPLQFYSCCAPAYMPEDTAIAPESIASEDD